MESVLNEGKRLRLVLKDESIIDVDKLSDVEVVKGHFSNSGQFQIIIGSGTVDEVYKEILSRSSWFDTQIFTRVWLELSVPIMESESSIAAQKDRGEHRISAFSKLRDVIFISGTISSLFLEVYRRVAFFNSSYKFILYI